MLDHLIQPQYASGEVRFGLFNAHRDEDEGRLSALLRGQHAERVCLLRGEAGIGRSYLLEAAAHRASIAGDPALVLRLDFEGWDDEPRDGLERFVEQMLDKRGMLRASSRDAWLEGTRAVAALAGKIGLKATMLSLLMDVEGAIELLGRLLSGSATPEDGPAREVVEVLDLLLDELCHKSAVVVHVKDAALLPFGAVRAWLFCRAQARPLPGEGGVVLAISCRPGTDPARFAPHIKDDALVLDVGPHDRDSLAALLDRRLGLSRVPDRRVSNLLVDSILTSTSGIPGQVANKLQAMVHDGVLVEDGQGAWNLLASGLESPETRGLLGRTLADEIELRIGVLPHYRDNARDFLRYGALCGEMIPAELVLGAMGLVEERQQDVLDLVDAHFVDTDHPLLVETDVQHRAFPSVSIYRFSSPLLRRAVVDQVDDRQRSEIAGSLLTYLEPRLPKTSRAEVRLLLEIAGQLDSEAAYSRYRTVLGVWVAMDESADVAAELGGWLTAENADSDVLWVLVNATRNRWPPQRRLILLDRLRSLEEDHPHGSRGLSGDRMAVLCFLRAEALHMLGNLEEAEIDARLACERLAAIAGEQAEPHAAALALLGAIVRQRGRFGEASDLLEKALRILDAVHGDTPAANTAAAAHALAVTLHAAGEAPGARRLFERALEIHRRLYHSDTHPSIAIDKWRLALLLRDGEEFDAARTLAEEAAATAAETLGREHPQTRVIVTDLAKLAAPVGRRR